MNKDFKIKFGLRIKELRLSKSLTQEQLAEKLGMERSNLAKIEAGNHFPGSDNLEKILDIFNIEPYELFNIKHFKSKTDLINEIVVNLNDFDMHKVQYIYKSVINLKNIN